ncbi:carbohydrate kinase family protein [Streptomyces sp. NRRL S-1448]|uniref:carbohydrate kinase family protein n=1 Tax=Streptomyces sp. NRRL S-1448 TaxID=1463883 RepID=UPI001F2B60F2|nr:carbohydrate kinase family protein [Streptomyces sp. NRRL S-1448]
MLERARTAPPEGATAAKRVLVAGGTNFDIIVQADRLPAEHEKLRGGTFSAMPGGSAANTAQGLARQGCAVRLASAVGNDALGRVCLDDLRAGGVDTSLVQVDTTRTSMALVFSAGAGKRMMTFAGADREAAIGAVSEDEVRAVDHLHVVGEPAPPLRRLVNLARQYGRSISVEWNGRDMSTLGQGASLNLMNADEARSLPGASPDDTAATAQRYAEALKGEVIVTLGSRGALWASPGRPPLYVPTRSVEPVDRTGGGDAFNAGVIAGWLSGASTEHCLRRGLDAALHVITRIGAQP